MTLLFKRYLGGSGEEVKELVKLNHLQCIRVMFVQIG